MISALAGYCSSSETELFNDRKRQRSYLNWITPGTGKNQSGVADNRVANNDPKLATASFVVWLTRSPG